MTAGVYQDRHQLYPYLQQVAAYRLAWQHCRSLNPYRCCSFAYRFTTPRLDHSCGLIPRLFSLGTSITICICACLVWSLHVCIYPHYVSPPPNSTFLDLPLYGTLEPIESKGATRQPGRTRDQNVISVVTMRGVDGRRKERKRGCT